MDIEKTENKEVKELKDNKIEKVTGGRKGLWREIKIFNDYCDYCGEKIDGEARYDVHINIPNKIMCNKCFEREKSNMGNDAAVFKWMGVKPSSNGEINIDIHKNMDDSKDIK